MIQVYCFYTYTIFHGYVKSRKYIYFYTYTILHNIKLIYIVLQLHLHVLCFSMIGDIESSRRSHVTQN